MDKMANIHSANVLHGLCAYLTYYYGGLLLIVNLNTYQVYI